MCTMNTNTTCNLSKEQEKQMVELLPSVNLPVEKTMYVSSRTPLHNFKLNDLVWGSRKLLHCVETKSRIVNKSSPVLKPCIKAKRCKRQSCSPPVSKELEVVRERSVKRKEGLFTFSLRKEEIEQDFIRVTGRMPVRKMKVKKTFKNAKQQQKYINYQKYLKEIVPGNWLSEISRV